MCLIYFLEEEIVKEMPVGSYLMSVAAVVHDEIPSENAPETYIRVPMRTEANHSSRARIQEVSPESGEYAIHAQFFESAFSIKFSQNFLQNGEILAKIFRNLAKVSLKFLRPAFRSFPENIKSKFDRTIPNSSAIQ